MILEWLETKSCFVQPVSKWWRSEFLTVQIFKFFLSLWVWDITLLHKYCCLVCTHNHIISISKISKWNAYILNIKNGFKTPMMIWVYVWVIVQMYQVANQYSGENKNSPPKNPWDVMGYRIYLFWGPRGVNRRAWCFHKRGQDSGPWNCCVQTLC